MNIGDKVQVTDANLETFGSRGEVVEHQNENVVRVKFHNTSRYFNKENLTVISRVKQENKDSLHVAILIRTDDDIDIDFSNNPSLKTIEEEFHLQDEGEVVIGTMEEIKEAITKAIESWDHVIGVIDGEAFHAARTVIFEGKMYNVTYCGHRVPFMSIYPNIIKVENTQ